jgi:transcriptional regulator with XRE-family HTH domain
MTEDHPLRVWRKGKRLTLDALGKRVGVSASHLSEVERGKNALSLELAAKLSRETQDADGMPEVPLEKFVPQTEAAQ